MTRCWLRMARCLERSAKEGSAFTRLILKDRFQNRNRARVLRRPLGSAGNDAGNDFGGGAPFPFQMQGRRRGGRAQHLVRLVLKRNGVAIPPHAPELEGFPLPAATTKGI